MRVRDAMTGAVHCARPEDDLAHARAEMLRRRVSHLPVVDDAGSVVGMLDLAALVEGARLDAQAGRRRPGLEGSVASRMATGVPAVGPDAAVEDAAAALAERGACAALVQDRTGLLGILAVPDVLAALAPRARGLAKVGEVMRPDLPSVHRHASLDAVLQRMREADAGELAVVEGQATLPGTPPQAAEATRDPDHRGATALDFGIVGLVNVRTVASGAWFDRHVAGVRPGKRLREAMRVEAAGPKRWRHVEEVDTVAEDLMTRDVRTVTPGEDLGLAAARLVEAGAHGLPVVGDGMARPGYLDRRDVLAALLRAVPALR